MRFATFSGLSYSPFFLTNAAQSNFNLTEHRSATYDISPNFPPRQNSIFNPIVTLSQNGRLRVKMANLWVTEWLTHFMVIFQHHPDPQLEEGMESYFDRM